MIIPASCRSVLRSNFRKQSRVKNEYMRKERIDCDNMIGRYVYVSKEYIFVSFIEEYDNVPKYVL